MATKNLLKPEDLGVIPDKFEISSPSYDYVKQKSTGLSPLMTGMGTPTFNGTQTYAGNGMPSDSDQDNDRSS